MCDTQIVQFLQKLFGYDIVLSVWLEQKLLHQHPTNMNFLSSPLTLMSAVAFFCFNLQNCEEQTLNGDHMQ